MRNKISLLDIVSLVLLFSNSILSGFMENYSAMTGWLMCVFLMIYIIYKK